MALALFHLCCGLAVVGAALQPYAALPSTPEGAATQAAQAAIVALSESTNPVRLQICVHGSEVTEEGPLPAMSVCSRLVELLGRSEKLNPSNIHFFFDGAKAASAWEQHAADHDAGQARWGLLADEHEDEQLKKAELLVVVAPCNRARVRGRPAKQDGKLESVQRLVCGAKEVPIILVNPDLEAMLVTRRVGTDPVPPMFMSDFEHAFFLAEAQAKVGHITAVRRVWGRAWEIYRVEQGIRRSDTDDSSSEAALECTTLALCTEQKPPSADRLADYARRRRARGLPRREVPGQPLEPAWAAEGGWGLD